MKINCLSCGHSINLDDDTYSDYEGLIKCYACSALLDVKLVEGSVKAVNLPERSGLVAVPAQRSGADQGHEEG